MNRSQKERIQYIFPRFLEGVASPDERIELSALLQAAPGNEEWVELLEEIYSTQPTAEHYDEQQWEPMLAELIRRTRTPHTTRWRWGKMAVAASILLIFGLGSYFLFFSPQQPKGGEPVVKTQEERFKNDVAPGMDGAILRLANGVVIVLDTAANGSLAMQSNTQVRKMNGTLVYQPGNSGSAAQSIVYNTLETPRGRKYKLVLPDGTDVWLDAASSITFPSMFIGHERKVSITGQAYFEVRPDKTHPFKVDVAGTGEVEVLGTHFNINAYSNEATIKITLLEGSVRVKPEAGNQESVIIKPGQQAVSKLNGELAIVSNADIEEVMAWKNGRFYFENTSIESIMKQVERWYDVEVIYQDRIPHLFVAKIPRDVPVAELLKLLELTERVHFKIEGKKITVMK